MTISIRLLAAAMGLAAMLASGPAMADAVNTPECRRDLAAANRHIEAIRAREKRFVPGNLTRNCPLLRQNLADMAPRASRWTAASRAMSRAKPWRR